MVASQKRKIMRTDQPVHERSVQIATAEMLCTCSPLSPEFSTAGFETTEEEQAVPSTGELNHALRLHLRPLLAHMQTVSVILLHVSQVESPALASQATLPQKRRRFHAPTGFMEQLLANIRRVIRTNDEILQHAEAGAALILPNVDRYGAQRVSERIFHSIDLMHAETVIPPLTRETTILLGYGSTEPGCTLEHLLCQTGNVAHRLILRPALNRRRLNLTPFKASTVKRLRTKHAPTRQRFKKQQEQASGNIPFMQLPEELPASLKHLIPYTLAWELRCAPVGRDNNTLTVAMAYPPDSKALDLLAKETGLTIFPVSCEEAALDGLLAKKW
jgi:hypothetical protein